MISNKYILGDLITQRREKNPGGNLPIRGVSKDGLQPPKQIDADTSIYNVYYRNDFVYNPARMELGSIAFNDEFDKAICSSLYEVFFVRRTDLVIPEYLALFVKNPEFARYCDYIGSGSAREYCRFDNISRIPISLPSIDEQRKIVHDYQVITNRIALLRKINDSLLKYGLLYFEKTKTDDIARGDSWENCTVGSLVERGYIYPPMDGNHGELHPKASDYVLSGVPFIMANDLSEGFVNYSKCAFISETQSKTLRKGFSKKGDVLLTHKATIGRVAIVNDEYETIVLTPQVTFYRPINYISTVFLKYSFVSKDFQLSLKAFADAGSTRSYIGILEQLKLPVALAGKESMQRLTTVLNSIESQRFNNNTEIQRLLEVRLLLTDNLIKGA